MDRRTSEEKDLADRLSVVKDELPYSDIDYKITRNRDVDGAFGTRLDNKKGTDNYYSVIAYTSTGYVSLTFNLCGLNYFRRPQNTQDTEAKETEIERELRRQARAFLNLFFSARNSIISSKKHSSSLAITYHFSRDDDNFPTAQEVRIAKDELTKRLQKTVDLWLENENPQKPV